MTKPLVTLPSVQRIAENALNAHRRGILQATARKQPDFPSRCTYYDALTKTKCVIGSSIPPRIAKLLDARSDNTITDLFDEGLVKLADTKHLDVLRYLQQLHDRAFNSASEKVKLLRELRVYASAALVALALLLPVAARAQDQSSGFAIAPNGQVTNWGQGDVFSFGPNGVTNIGPQGGYWCCGSQGFGWIDNGPVAVDPISPFGPQIIVPAVPGE